MPAPGEKRGARVSFGRVRGVAGLIFLCVTIQSAPAQAAAPATRAGVATTTPAARGESLTRASATIDPLVGDWLDDWLANGKKSVHVVAMHIPPLDPVGTRNAAFASRAEAATLLAKLAEARVDLTLYGHIHSYYSFQNAGISAFISGGGGANPERADDIGRHFMVFDVDATRGVLSHEVVRVDHGDEIDEDE